MRFLLGLGILCHSGLLFASVPPNDEKLIESLIEQGVICQGLSYEQQQKALSIYLQKRVGKEKNRQNHAQIQNQKPLHLNLWVN